MSGGHQTFLDRCFKDKNGRIVIFQRPNAPLITWVVCSVLLRILGNPDSLTSTPVLTQVLQAFSFGSIFTWAWLEIFQGSSYGRRVLGLIVMYFVIANIISTAV